LVFGDRPNAAEILDSSTGQWRKYRNLPSDWQARDCLLQDGNMLYHIGLYLEAVDLSVATEDGDDGDEYEDDTADDFDVVRLADVPEALRLPQTCSLLTRNGVKGIMIRTGHWVSLDTYEWTNVAGQIWNPLSEIPNSMRQFRDLPTIFGNPYCDDNNNFLCDFSGVTQYNPDLNKYNSMTHRLITD